MRARSPIVLVALAAAFAAGCTSADEIPTDASIPDTPTSLEEDPAPGGPLRGSETADYPTVAGIELTRDRGNLFDIELTISSPYDSPERYADGWKVETPDGRLLGEMQLLHDHADEQPFTRVQEDVRIPPQIMNIVIQASDSVNGYGGPELTVELRGKP